LRSLEERVHGAFADAPFAAGGWERALRVLAEATGSARAHLIAVGGAKAFPLNCLIDPPRGFAEEFVEISGGSPDVNWRIAACAPPLQIRSERHYEQARKALRFDVYDEFADRHDMFHGCQTVLSQDSSQFVGLATLRTRKDGKTSAADRRLFAHAAPRVLGAVKIAQALEHQGGLLLLGALEAMRATGFLCDRQGRVAGLTHSAEAAVREGRNLALRNDRLSATDPRADQAMQRAIARLLQAGAGESETLWLPGGDDPASMRRCELFVLPRQDWSFGFEPRLLVMLGAAAGHEAAHRHLLTGLLGLTAAEADVAVHALKGAAREEIAAIRRTSLDTVGSQFKSIFQKLDVHREAELVALLGRLLH